MPGTLQYILHRPTTRPHCFLPLSVPCVYASVLCPTVSVHTTSTSLHIYLHPPLNTYCQQESLWKQITRNISISFRSVLAARDIEKRCPVTVVTLFLPVVSFFRVNMSGGCTEMEGYQSWRGYGMRYIWHMMDGILLMVLYGKGLYSMGWYAADGEDPLGVHGNKYWWDAVQMKCHYTRHRRINMIIMVCSQGNPLKFAPSKFTLLSVAINMPRDGITGRVGGGATTSSQFSFQ